MTETNYKAKPNTRNAENRTLEMLRNWAEAAGEEALRHHRGGCTSAGSAVSGSLCPHGLWGPLGVSLRGPLQARILEWAAISSSRGSSQPKDQTMSPALTGGFSTTEPPGELHRGDIIKQLPFPKIKTAHLEMGGIPSKVFVTRVNEWMESNSVVRLSSIQFSCSVVSDSLRLMNCSMPGLPVHH